jgi:hypothetical protein
MKLCNVLRSFIDRGRPAATPGIARPRAFVYRQ